MQRLGTQCPLQAAAGVSHDHSATSFDIVAFEAVTGRICIDVTISSHTKA